MTNLKHSLYTYIPSKQTGQLTHSVSESVFIGHSRKLSLLSEGLTAPQALKLGSRHYQTNGKIKRFLVLFYSFWFGFRFASCMVFLSISLSYHTQILKLYYPCIQYTSMIFYHGLLKNSK